MNRQLLSTIIIWLFLLPSLWWLRTVEITASTPFYTIQGEVTKVECKEINKRLSGEVLIFYNGNKEKIRFDDKKLRKDNFEVRCRELTKLIDKGMRFTAVTVDTFHQVLALEVESIKILDFKKEVKAFNHKNSIFFNMALWIGIIMTIGNFLIWYYKGNPDKWVRGSFFS